MISLTAEETRTTPDIRAWVSWTTIAIGWGLTYHGMALGARWAPLAFIALRHTIGGAILLLTAMLYADSTDRRIVRRLMGIGILMWSVGNGLLIWSLQPSGLNEGHAALVVATIPLCTGCIAGFGARGRHLSWLSAGALLMGILGAFLTLADYQPQASAETTTWPLAPGSPVQAVLGLVLGVVSWSCGSVLLARTVQPSNEIWSAGIQMLSGGLCLVMALAVSILVSGHGVPAMPYDVVGALLFVTLVGSVLCPMSYVHAVQHLPVTVVALHAYLNPLVALLFAGYLGSQMRWPTLIGAITVLGAVALAGRLEMRR